MASKLSPGQLSFSCFLALFCTPIHLYSGYKKGWSQHGSHQLSTAFEALSLNELAEYHFKRRHLSGKSELTFYSTPMKVLSLASLLFATGFIQTAAGIRCDSFCAACWKNGSPGVDIKMSCDGLWNCYSCPGGYDSLHCAQMDRCM